MKENRANVLATVLGGLVGGLLGTLLGALAGAALAGLGLSLTGVDPHAPAMADAPETPATMRPAVLLAGAVAGGAVGCPLGGLLGAALARSAVQRLRRR